MTTKEEILKRIRQLAKENRNNTPSEKKFYKYAGIGIYNLHKNGWSNYGELVRDANLTPNKFDKTKYNRKQLCDIFIKAIREKGTWPTRSNLDVKHLSNPAFPDSSTFYKKLGLTENLAQTILEYVEKKQGHKDIIKICESVIEKYKNKSPATENITSGFVYLGKQHGDYKIGKAKDANRRREDITLLGSEPFELIHKIETDDMDGIESYWHKRFKSKNKRGEWFELTKTDIQAFKRWRKIF